VNYAPIQIVDESDKPLRPGTMDEAQQKGLWHRVVRVIVGDEQGRILLQKRGATMATFPNCWDTSAAGHVDAGEDYIVAAKRETFEEIGLKDANLKEVESYKLEGMYKDKIINRFNKTYQVQVNSDQKFRPDQKEVQKLQWFTQQEVKGLFRDYPDEITDGLRHAFPKYI